MNYSPNQYINYNFPQQQAQQFYNPLLNIGQTFQGNTYPHQNSYPYPQFIVHSQNPGFNNNPLNNFASAKQFEKPSPTVQRPRCPLDICDPLTRKPIEINKDVKSTKSHSLLPEIKEVSHNNNDQKNVPLDLIPDQAYQESDHKTDIITDRDTIDKCNSEEERVTSNRADIDHNVDQNKIIDELTFNDNHTNELLISDDTVVPSQSTLLDKNVPSDPIPDQTDQGSDNKTDIITDRDTIEKCNFEGEHMTSNNVNIDHDIDQNKTINHSTSNDNHTNELVISDDIVVHSQSILDTLKTLSNGIHETNSTSFDNNINETSNVPNVERNKIDERRLNYSRKDLLEISKSPLCRKPLLNCKEIEIARNIDLTSKLNGDYGLMCTENGYKPPNKRHDDETHLKTCKRQFKSILNKIVPQNFAICFNEVKVLIESFDWSEVDDKVYMDCFITEIFHKAVQEEAYSVIYAQLCIEIIKYEKENDMKWSFQSLLVDHCKVMFETPLQDQLNDVRKHWEYRIDEESDDKLKNLYKSDIEEQVKKAKDKFFGNIRFIGELYLHHLLQTAIINRCINELLSKSSDGDAMLSLCKLLETCGKQFDNVKSDIMKNCIGTMDTIVKTSELQDRIKFRLQEIIDMSRRNWVLRQVQAQKMIKPKTLDQVKQDGIDEKLFEAAKLSNKSSLHVIKKSCDQKFKNYPNKNQSMGFNSLQMNQSKNIELKPSCQLWRGGSRVRDDACLDNDSLKRKVNPSLIKKPDHAGNVINNVIKIAGRFSLLTPTDESELNDVNNLSSGDEVPQRTESSTPISIEEQLTTISDIEILDSDGIFTEFLESGYLQVPSWCQLSDVTNTLVNYIDRIMEKDTSVRNCFGNEIAKLIANDNLLMDDFVAGVLTFLDDIDDLKTDIPLIWTFLAEFLERLIVDDKSDLSFYKVIFQTSPTISSLDVTNCLLLCLQFADSRLGHDVITRLLEKCPWSLRDFILIDVSFLQSRKLGFLIDFVIDRHYFDPYQAELAAMLAGENETINIFLQTSFSPDVMQTKHFVFFLSNTIFSHLSKLSEEEIKLYLGQKTLFFLEILNRQIQFEKELLNALGECTIISENEGLLTIVIRYLMDTLISLCAFEQFIENDRLNTSAIIVDSTNYRHMVNIIRSMLTNPCCP